MVFVELLDNLKETFHNYIFLQLLQVIVLIKVCGTSTKTHTDCPMVATVQYYAVKTYGVLTKGSRRGKGKWIREEKREKGGEREAERGRGRGLSSPSPSIVHNWGSEFTLKHFKKGARAFVSFQNKGSSPITDDRWRGDSKALSPSLSLPLSSSLTIFLPPFSLSSSLSLSLSLSPSLADFLNRGAESHLSTLSMAWHTPN